MKGEHNTDIEVTGTCRIAFAGAGKVASAFCYALNSKGYSITKIVSPGQENGIKLAGSYGAEWSDKLVFPVDTDLIIVAVPDHMLEKVLSDISCGKDTIVVHTAGSYGLEVFPGSIIRKGVFYPLMTFTRGRNISFAGLPLFIESNDVDSESKLISLGESIGCRVIQSEMEHRRLLHVAAVFVSNFTNYMFTSGKTITSRSHLSFELLKPLIYETVNRAMEGDPESSQTGPAVRHDFNTIEKHSKLLSFSPELEKVYKEISASIMNHYKQLKDE